MNPKDWIAVVKTQLHWVRGTSCRTLYFIFIAGFWCHCSSSSVISSRDLKKKLSRFSPLICSSWIHILNSIQDTWLFPPCAFRRLPSRTGHRKPADCFSLRVLKFLCVRYVREWRAPSCITHCDWFTNLFSPGLRSCATLCAVSPAAERRQREAAPAAGWGCCVWLPTVKHLAVSPVRWMRSALCRVQWLGAQLHSFLLANNDLPNVMDGSGLICWRFCCFSLNRATRAHKAHRGMRGVIERVFSLVDYDPGVDWCFGTNMISKWTRAVPSDRNR